MEQTQGFIRHVRLSASSALIALLGVAFARTWVSLVFIQPGSGTFALPFPHDVFDWGFCALNVALALLARRIVPLSERRWAQALALGGMLAASLAFCAGLYGLWPTTGVSTAASVATSVIGGVGYACFLLLNAEFFAGVSILRIVLYLSGSRVISSCMAWLLQACDAPRMAFALFVLPVGAVLLVHAAYVALPTSDRQPARYPRYSFPWKLVALVAVFSFAYGLRQASLAAGAGQHASLSTAIVAGAVFVLAYFFSDRIDIAKLCRLPMPIMLCGLLLVPAEGILGNVASSYLVSIGYTLVSMLVGVLLYDMSKRTGVAVLPLMAATNAMQLFIVLGNYSSRALNALVPSHETATLVVSILTCVLLVVSFFLLFSERELESRWGIRVLSEPSLGEEGQRADQLAARCDELSRAYGLTAREDEVLRELASRKETSAIAQNLLIAPGTLKAHTRHIYEKMDIHTREELYELLGIGERPGEYSAGER